MALPALLLGDPGRTPFAGHLRVRVDVGGSWLTAAGRLATGDGLVAAYAPARRVEAALRTVTGKDRHGLLWRAWELLAALPGDALGSAGAADLSLLLVAGDAAGISVAGVGLAAVWGRTDKLLPLVEGRHPLLAGPGRPKRTPGALELELRPNAIIGCPGHLPPTVPSLETAMARCGWRL